MSSIKRAYSVHVLYPGYSTVDSESKQMKANCSCTLIKGPKNVIVDTMTCWDADKIVSALAEHNLRATDVDYVVSTHGHSDHVGNNNLFLEATHVVGLSVSRGDVYFMSAFEDGSNFQIDEDIDVVPTPGHTLSDVTVIVRSDNLGICAIVGDLFEKEDDIENPSLWMDAGSESPGLQRRNRLDIAKRVEWIVPGHGPAFKVVPKSIEMLESNCTLCNSL